MIDLPLTEVQSSNLRTLIAIRLGLEAGLSALIVSTQPLLVAAAAPFLLAEPVGARRWLGCCRGAWTAAISRTTRSRRSSEPIAPIGRR
mgnify:CR=1 FL=1